MLTDPIADMFTRIRNAVLAKKNSVLVPFSKQKQQILKILVENNYLEKVETIDFKEKKGKRKMIRCYLKYYGQRPAIQGLVKVSKPGLRIYKSSRLLPQVLSGYGIAIVSTPKGIMTAQKARAQKVGGEIICKVW